MARFARFLVVALLAVFAAWSSASVSNATTMALEMAASDGMATDMADCEACGSEEMGDAASLVCDVACVSPILADLVTSQSFTSAPVASHAMWFVRSFDGRAYPPDPHPPRSVLPI